MKMDPAMSSIDGYLFSIKISGVSIFLYSSVSFSDTLHGEYWGEGEREMGPAMSSIAGYMFSIKISGVSMLFCINWFPFWTLCIESTEMRRGVGDGSFTEFL